MKHPHEVDSSPTLACAPFCSRPFLSSISELGDKEFLESVMGSLQYTEDLNKDLRQRLLDAQTELFSRLDVEDEVVLILEDDTWQLTKPPASLLAKLTATN